MAEIFKSLIIEVRDIVPQNSTKVVDAIPLSNFQALEYSVAFYDSTGKSKTLKLFIRKDDGSLADQVYGKGGFPFNLAIGAFLNGLNAELRIQNLEPFPINIKAARLII